MLKWAAIALISLSALIGATVGVSLLNRACSRTSLASAPIEEGVAENWSKTGDQSQTAANQQHNAAANAVATLPKAKPQYAPPHSEQSADGTQWQPRNWRYDFSCGIKATDVLIALFTLFLVCIGAWQGWHLKRTVDSFVVGERPYIFPSAPNWNSLFPPADQRRYYGTTPKERWYVPFVSFTFGNFGRTIGVIRVIRIELLLDDLPKKPTFAYAEEIPGQIVSRSEQQTSPLNFGLNRGMTPQEFEEIKLGTRKVHAFGYIKYTDTWGRLHEKGFAFQIHVTGPHRDCEVAGGSPFNYAKVRKTPKEYAD